MNGIIRPFAVGELDELALLAQRLNGRRETGSSFCCSRAEDIRREFEETMEYGFACWAEEGPLGLVSCFFDREKGNADCSLLLDVHGEPYQEIAEALVSAVRERLGTGPACTFFFPTENGDCRSFLERIGAQRQENEYILLLNRKDWKPPHGLAEPRPVREGEREAFAALHDGVFPDAYASGRDIWEDLGRTRFVYVISEGEGLAAYGVLKTQGGRRAVAEMVGVREGARRRGYGRAVLNHLAGQAFSRFGAESLELVVDADNQNALRLYLDSGFQIRQENNCYVLR